jgi:hypothetical protein
MSRAFVPPSECPVCGADVPRGAKACPECGADERSGWNEDEARYDGLDLPEEAFDEPHRSPRNPLRRNLHPVWIIGGVLTLVALILVFIFR